MNILSRLKSNKYKKVNVEIKNEDCFIYESDVTVNTDKIKFQDKSVDNTYIEIEILDIDSIHLARTGEITMDVTYKSNTTSITTYIDNTSGFKMELETMCYSVLFDDNKIIVNYANYNYDDELTNVELNFSFS